MRLGAQIVTAGLVSSNDNVAMAGVTVVRFMRSFLRIGCSISE